MYKIAVLGDYDSIYGFATLGLDTFPVTTHEEAAEELQKSFTNWQQVVTELFILQKPGPIS